MKLLNFNLKLQRKPVILLSFMLFGIHAVVSHPLSYAKVTKSDSIILNDPQQQINQSYRGFNDDLNQLIQEIEQASKNPKSAQNIRVESQLESLKILRKNIENWQPTNQSFLVEGELKRISKATDNLQSVLEIIDNEGITTNSLYRIQRQIGMSGQGNLEQQFKNLLTYLDDENKKLATGLDQINKNANIFQILIILLVLLFLVILVIIWLISQWVKSKKSPYPLGIDQTKLENLLSEMVKEELNKENLSLPKDNPLLENPEEMNELIHQEVSEFVEQLKQELLEKQENSSLSSPSKNLVTSEKLNPINSDRFIPLYEEMVNHYNNNNLENYKPIRVSQIFEPTNYSGQISPKFQPADNGLYYIIQIKIESYLIPIPNVIINQHNQKSFTNVFDCFPPDLLNFRRFKLLKPALVRQEGDQWRLKEKGVLQFEQI